MKIFILFIIVFVLGISCSHKRNKLSIDEEKLATQITNEEKEKIEVSDFGLSNLDEIGIQLLVYVNTERVCAKEIVLLPNQVCPEHKHVSVEGNLGKEETFRCRKGKVYLKSNE